MFTSPHLKQSLWSSPSSAGGHAPAYLQPGLIAVLLILILAKITAADLPTNPPILISESSSTRAIAVESLTFTREPFALTSSYAGSGQRTRVMVFAMNLALQPEEDLSVVTADAEDASHRHYPLTVESVRPVPTYEWLSEVVFKLNDDLGDVGDVLIGVSYRGWSSNRVRIAIGHSGGGPDDDPGSLPTPAPPYTISGQLTVDGQALPGFPLTLSGAETATGVTGVDGRYSFTVNTVGDYLITPAASPFYTFQTRAFSNLHRNQVADLAGTLRYYTVAGSVQNGVFPANDIEVTISGSRTASTKTDSLGNYSFVLPANGNYTITPSAPYYDFTPINTTITALDADKTTNFHGARRFFTISGKLMDEQGNGLPGLAVKLLAINQPGNQENATVTDSDGRYQFANLMSGYDYVITPPSTSFFTFTGKTVSNLIGNQTLDFAGTLRYYTVAGTVQNGIFPSNDIEVTISGSQTASTRTDVIGNYSFVLPASGNYTITPSSPYYDFIPVNTTINALDANSSRSFYSARRVFTISGKLIDQQGNGLAGLAVKLFAINQPADQERATVTDSAGGYQFTNLMSGYDYVITPPSTLDFTFHGKTVVDLIGNQTLDFTGLRRLTLNGKIRDQSGNGLIGIFVTLTGSESGTAITGPDGSYTLQATATGNYVVTPFTPQDFYAFAPSSAQFNNLTAAQTADFTATLAPLTSPSYVLEFDGTRKSVDYLSFWQEGVNLGHFFWEFWAMPGANAGGTYMLTDGYGGAHALLFGVGNFGSSEPERYEMSGNIFDGVKYDNYFGSDMGPAIGEWGHFGVGWDGQNIITYFNGVPVGKSPFSGPRRTPGPGGGGGRLMIGGSDHSNFDGRIAEVRGFEDRNPRENPSGVEASFAPETVFGLDGNLLSYYFRAAPAVADLSHGYNGVAHVGFPRSTAAGVIFDCPGCPPPAFVVDPSAPNFVNGSPASPANVPPAPATPVGALIFDSFSRINSTYTFGAHGGLGSTEAGAAGVQVWQTNQAPSNPQPFGILNTRAVLLANSTSVAWIPTGSPTGNVDVRVNRYNGRWGTGIHTGLSFRVLDANNFFFAYTANDAAAPGNKVVHVGYYSNGQRVDLTTTAMPLSNWTTLRVVTTSSGTLQVYLDSTLVYATSNALLAAATGAGLYSDSAGMGLVNRWDNFTVFEAH